MSMQESMLVFLLMCWVSLFHKGMLLFGGIVGFGFVFFSPSVLECTISFSRLAGKISCKLFLKTACFPCP